MAVPTEKDPLQDNSIERCPVSGLPIRQAPLWRNFFCSQGFSCSYKIIGDRIILYQGRGYSDYEGEKASVDFGNRIMAQSLAPDKPFVILQDWQFYENSSARARKYFIDNMMAHKRLAGVIFFNTTSMQALSVRLGQSLRVVPFKAWVEKDYEAAVLRALGLLDPGTPVPERGSQLGDEAAAKSRLMPGILGLAYHKHMEQLLSFLQNLDWQAPVDESVWNLDRDNPFLPVFDAILVSKANLDRAFDQRRKAEAALAASEARYRDLLEMANSIVIRWTQDGTITFFNEYARSVFGYEQHEVLGRRLASAIIGWAAQGQADPNLSLEQISRKPELFRDLVRRVYTKDGTPIWVNWSIKAFTNPDGDMEALGIGSDITDRIRAEEQLSVYRQNLEEQAELRTMELRSSEDHYREIFRNAPIGIFQCSAEGLLDDCNRAMLAMMGCGTKEELLEHIQRSGLFGVDQLRAVVGPAVNGWRDYQQKVTTPDGRTVFAKVTLRRLADSGRIEGFFQDETKRRLAERLLMEQAVTDDLTGIPNRRKLLGALEEEFARGRRYHLPLSLCMVDLDNFKSVNDRWGHDTGDGVLRRVAGVMSHGLRESDLCGRYGGEEFCILLPHTGSEEAMLVLQRLLKHIAEIEHTAPKGQTFHITASMGLAWLTPFTKNTSHLLQSADQALYTAKEKGKNRICLYQEED